MVSWRPESLRKIPPAHFREREIRALWTAYRDTESDQERQCRSWTLKAWVYAIYRDNIDKLVDTSSTGLRGEEARVAEERSTSQQRWEIAYVSAKSFSVTTNVRFIRIILKVIPSTKKGWNWKVDGKVRYAEKVRNQGENQCFVTSDRFEGLCILMKPTLSLNQIDSVPLSTSHDRLFTMYRKLCGFAMLPIDMFHADSQHERAYRSPIIHDAGVGEHSTVVVVVPDRLKSMTVAMIWRGYKMYQPLMGRRYHETTKMSSPSLQC